MATSRAHIETAYAAAGRALWRAQKLAEAMGNDGEAQDCMLLRAEVTRLLKASLAEGRRHRQARAIRCG